MDEVKYDWKTYTTSIVIPAEMLVPCYKWVRHPRSPHYRNYRRAVKGGVTFAFILWEKKQRTELYLHEQCLTQLFKRHRVDEGLRVL